MEQPTHVLLWLLLLGSCTTLGQPLTETCMAESYRAECPKGQVVVMERAEYGRMTSSRCITAEYGVVGCENNVIELLDSWCSGQRECDFQTTDLHKANTECSKDLMLFLRSAYSCVSVIRREFSYCTSHQNVTLQEVDGFLASQMTEETGCGSHRVPWIIKAKPGQTIDITMMDFGAISNKNTHDKPCMLYGYIVEKAANVNQSICGSDQRQQQVYTSKSSVVEIVILPSQLRKKDNRFLLHYQTRGCPDLSPPANSHYKRKGDTATIECDVGGRSWDLECEEHGWKGVVGNCSALVAASHESKDLSMSTVLMLSAVIGTTVVMSLVILTIGICYVKRYRKKRQKKRHKRKDKDQKNTKEETPLEPYLKPSQASEVKMRGNFRPQSYGGASAAFLGFAPGFLTDYPNAGNRSSIASGYRYSSSTMYAQIIDELPHPNEDSKEKNTNTGPTRAPGHQRQMSLQLAHNRTASWSFRHSRQPSLPFGHSRQPSITSNDGYGKVILAQSPGGTKVLIHQSPENEQLLPMQKISPEQQQLITQQSPARPRLQLPPPEAVEPGPPKLPPRGQKPGTSPRPPDKEPKSAPVRPATFDFAPQRTSFLEMDRDNSGYYSPTTGHKYYVLEQQPMLIRSVPSANYN